MGLRDVIRRRELQKLAEEGVEKGFFTEKQLVKARQEQARKKR